MTEFSTERRGLTILQEHRNHFVHVFTKLLHGFTLAMRAGKTGHIAHQKIGIRATLDNKRVIPHLPSPFYKLARRAM